MPAHPQSASWDRATRWLHGAIALGVVLQLALAMVMTSPDAAAAGPGEGQGLFRLHEVIGLSLLIPVSLHWAWQLSGRGRAGVAHLFPFSAAARAQVLADWRLLRQGVLPEPGPRGGLAGLVHGVGLLNVTAMLASGSLLFLTLEYGAGVHSRAFALLGDIHGVFAALMWVYLAGHVGAVLLHGRRGDPVARDMFRL